MKRRPEKTRRVPTARKPLRGSAVQRTRRVPSAALLLCVVLFVLAVAGTSCRSARVLTSRAGKPARIISLTPSTTEILYGVGAFDRVVAVSDYCTYPPEVNKLPRVGGWNNPNMEQIASLRPDLVVFSEAQSQFVKDKFEGMGIRTLAVPSQTLEDAYGAIELVGRATGDEEAAQKLLAQTRSSVETVRLATERLPRRRVLCVVDRVPGTLRDLYTAAEGSFIAQLIQVAGGEPVSPPARAGWGKLQKEAVVALDPEVVLDLMMHKEGGSFDEDTLAVWKELPTLRAVREGRVYPVRDETVLHPSQLVGDTARRFAELIHPEAFAKK
ncbi:MAG: cobalamin transport system substrate-binding protein [Acidobacteriota bacterium]|nr:cobalamin transport system substrate-binding protein [Acidobacteriota bacterium]